jgi:imidazolonepropionase
MDRVWRNLRLATMDGADIDDAALVVQHERIAWLGAQRDLPTQYRTMDTVDGGNAWATPGLIDCHTHIVYAGDRSDEFEARLEGETYEQIARRGGGIAATVRATRAAGEEQLLKESLPRVKALLAEGVTTLEVKSGYGLTLADEAKMLRVARRLGRELRVTVKTTFLGAHALPPEFAGRADDYVEELCDRMLPALAADGLVDAVDAFCETIGFTPVQTERVFRAACALGLPVKLHAEQLSDQSGAELVARYGGLSADHLEHLSSAGVAAMAGAGTVAVLLPGAFYFLRETQLPPVAALRAAGVPIAIATDCNPGTSPLTSLLTAMNMACTLFQLTPREALAGATINAARALGMQAEAGSLALGKRADFVLWDIERPAQLAASIGPNRCRQVVFGGSPRTTAR